MNPEREQAIKDAAAATNWTEAGIVESLDAPNDRTGYLLLEETAIIYAVSQRERVIQLERALRELCNSAVSRDGRYYWLPDGSLQKALASLGGQVNG